jgi:pSer/pThr/pTyr-binding forkhead associated (FHA) protein
MRDGHTRKLDVGERDRGFADFLANWQPTVVVLSGDLAGAEHAIDRPNVSLGRGPGVELVFDDSAMSREHAALEFAGGGMRIRDLGSTNGMIVNGAPVRAADLKSGDRFQLGEHLFQFVLEKRKREPRTYVLPDE